MDMNVIHQNYGIVLAKRVGMPIAVRFISLKWKPKTKKQKKSIGG